MSWDVTRRQVRNLEAKLDSSLNHYSRLTVSITRADQGASSWPGSDVGRRRQGGDEALIEENVALEEEIETMMGEVSQ
jgi:hypothetical protein